MPKPLNGYDRLVDDRDFFEEDEPLQDVRDAWEMSVKQKTYRPGITALIACHPARLTNGMANEAFASIAAQTLQPDTIILVNDLERAGAGRTRQKLLRMVETEWLAWCDSDDIWYPNHLQDLYQVATETDSVYVFSYFDGHDPFATSKAPQGHFGIPFNPATPYHTTITVLARTDIAQEVGFPESQTSRYSNEDWSWITGFSKLAHERGLKMTHLPKRTWQYVQRGQNSCGRAGQGDAM